MAGQSQQIEMTLKSFCLSDNNRAQRLDFMKKGTLLTNCIYWTHGRIFTYSIQCEPPK